MIWLQISAGQGPDECAWVVSAFLKYLQAQANKHQIELDLLESEAGQIPQTLKSVLISLNGPEAESFARQWQGSIQWIGQSPFRPHHKRKNWFIGVEIFEPPPENSWQESDFKFENLRRSGPGGQNVNKVETAVRITHGPSGQSIVANQERTQWRNRQLGLARLIALLQGQNQHKQQIAQQQRWLSHHQLERGNAICIFNGPEFRRSS